MTIIGPHRERLSISVDPRLHSRDQRERPLVAIVELAHFENVVGANVNAILFGLASGAIDLGREDARTLLAVGLR